MEGLGSVLLGLRSEMAADVATWDGLLLQTLRKYDKGETAVFVWDERSDEDDAEQVFKEMLDRRDVLFKKNRGLTALTRQGVSW